AVAVEWWPAEDLGQVRQPGCPPLAIAEKVFERPSPARRTAAVAAAIRTGQPAAAEGSVLHACGLQLTSGLVEFCPCPRQRLGDSADLRPQRLHDAQAGFGGRWPACLSGSRFERVRVRRFERDVVAPAAVRLSAHYRSASAPLRWAPSTTYSTV